MLFFVRNFDYKVVAIITTITSFLSIIASLTIIIPIFYRSVCFKPAIIQILHISTADFLASIFMFAAVIQNFVYDVNVSCVLTGSISNTFYISSFLFLILYAAQAYSAIHTKLKNGRIWRFFNTNYCFNFFNVTYCLAWILPFGLAIPVYNLLHNSYANTFKLSEFFSCLPLIHFHNILYFENQSAFAFESSKEYSYIALITQLGTLSLLILFMSLTLVEYHRFIKTKGIFGSNEQKNWSKRKQRVCYFLFSFIFCWICSIGLNIFILFSSNNVDLYPFHVAQALTNPLHGFFNAVVYGWQRKAFTNILKRDTGLEDHSQRDYESVTSSSRIHSTSDKIITFSNYMIHDYMLSNEFEHDVSKTAFH